MNYTKEYWNDVSRVVKCIPNNETLYDKTVLITGATGMVCSAVVDVIHYLNTEKHAGIKMLLAGRNEQKTKLRFSNVLSVAEYDFIQYDALNSEPLDVKTDYVVHGASNANPAVYASMPAETLLGNIVGLKTILDVARNGAGTRVLYVSSSEVYGNRTNGTKECYKENDYGFVDILNPRACYPNGKRTAETLCACYGSEYGVDYVIVRLGHIYGPSITPSDTRASAAFTRDAVNGRDIVMKSAGAQLRSYCYTLDCASGILAVLLNGEFGNAYNISNKESIVTIRDVAEELARSRSVQVIFENPSDEEKKGYNLMDNSALDSQKIEFLGWRAAFDLKEGVKATVRELVNA